MLEKRKLFPLAVSGATVVLLFFFGARIISFVSGKTGNRGIPATGASVDAERGDVIKYVEVYDAWVAAEESLNLAFAFSGKIEEIFTPDGTIVKKGDPIMKLETVELDLEKKGLEASYAKARANLDKALAGATPESVAVYKKQSSVYGDSVKDAKKALAEIIKSAYTCGEDAVRGKTNSIFTNPNSVNPQLTFTIGDANLESDIESKRSSLEEELDDWEDSVRDLEWSDDLDKKIKEADSKIEDIVSYLDKVAKAVNQLTVADGLSQDTIDALNTAISSARIETDAAKVSIKEVKAELTEAEGKYEVAGKDLEFISASARSEDVRAAQAEADLAGSRLEILKNKLDKAVIEAPMDGTVMKTFFKKAEIASQGQTAVLFSALSKKVRADVPEADIPSISVGNSAVMEINALPGEGITGKVESIKPRPIDKNGDIYYEVEIALDGLIAGLREGMTVDAKIEFGRKNGVIRAPNGYIEKAGGKSLVYILRNGKKEEVEVETGFSDENYTEIVGGINENEVLLEPGY